MLDLVHCILQLRETIGHVGLNGKHGPMHEAIEIAKTTGTDTDMDQIGREEISKMGKELTEYKNWFFICCCYSSSF